MKKRLSKLSMDFLKQFIDENEKLITYAINPYKVAREFIGAVMPKPYYTISNLKRSGYLRSKKIKNKDYYALTKKGEEIVTKIILKNKLKSTKWDGKWRILIFDIPETKRRYRENLRRVLRGVGFYKVQKSVWIYPYDVRQYLYMLLPGFREGDWFEFIEADYISSQNKIKKYFSIN